MGGRRPSCSTKGYKAKRTAKTIVARPLRRLSQNPEREKGNLLESSDLCEVM